MKELEVALRDDDSYYYNNIPIHAAKGLHEYTMKKILESCQNNTKKHILELGCGSGAFSQRLIDHGFTVTSVDVSIDNNFPIDSQAIELNLNNDFASYLDMREYDYIIALEIVEHLENPLHFLRQIKLLATSKSKVFCSFPNIYLFSAIRDFVKDGTFGNFNPFHYWNTGHIIIMTDWLFEQHLKKIGINFEEKYFPAPIDFPSSWKSFPVKLFYYFVCFFNKKIPPNVRLSDVVLYELGIEE